MQEEIQKLELEQKNLKQENAALLGRNTQLQTQMANVGKTGNTYADMDVAKLLEQMTDLFDVYMEKADTEQAAAMQTKLHTFSGEVISKLNKDIRKWKNMKK